MEISYWQSRWENNKTGWHMDTVYPKLPKVWPQLSVKSDATILVPLCGKSLDIQWFIDRSYNVIGVDASPQALQAIINRTSESFTKSTTHGFSVYRSDSLELWEGNVLKLPRKKISSPDLIYDKAAIIALPTEMRSRYAEKLRSLCTRNTRIMIQTFEYVQNEMNGPPFSVEESELKRLFGDQFSLRLLHKQSKLDALDRFRRRGLSSYLKEKVFLLKPMKEK